ncbi:MAG: sensor histidine kinase [Candidatus Promineifilaceae bacterium]|nr:sensor histidine kinase [Candidatus Promineifilaceae bacterium]
MHIYLTIQTVLVFVASLFYFELDFFAILYLPLCGQATFLLPRRQATTWLGMLVGVFIVGLLIQFGWPQALSFMILYSAALIFTAAFAAITIQAHEARLRSEELLANLQDAHEQLQQYAGQAEELARMKERNRLARELHDSVAQTLYGLSIQAEVASRRLDGGKIEEAPSNLADIRQVAQQSLAETRLLIFELRPPILQEEGLAAALRTRLEAVEGRSGLHIRSELRSGRLPPAVEGALYGIAIEALNNVVKHAQARDVQVALIQENGRVQLDIIDDGCVFTAEEQVGGSGLRNVRERAQGFDGRFTIHSMPGKGTTIHVEVSL